MGSIGASEIGVVFAVVIAFAVLFLLVPYWRIFKKAGFNPALSLLILIPIVNIVMIYYLAFAEWPSLRHAQNAKEVGSPVA